MPADAIRLIDGKTEFAFRTRDGGHWPALAGVVRPAAPREIRAHDARCREIRAKLGTPVAGKPVDIDAVEAEVVQAQATFFAERLVRWNVDAPISPETVAVLPWEIFTQLDSVIAGQSGLILGNSDATSTS